MIVRERNGRELSDRFEIGTRPGALELVAKQRFGITISIDNHTWGRGTPCLSLGAASWNAGARRRTAPGAVLTWGPPSASGAP